MSDGGNRIGTVSSVDPETGMVSVIFEDRDGEVTELLPYATFNEEYKLPQLGAKVVVMHLSNGGEMGIILGTPEPSTRIWAAEPISIIRTAY